MSKARQLTVACEFGWPKRIVEQVLQEQSFLNAGGLIEYLEENEEKLLAADKDVIASKCSQNFRPKLTLNIPLRKELNLEKQTARLYQRSLCQICGKTKRTYILLPCAHLAVCEFCISKTDHCPNCGEAIVSNIRTFLA